MEVLLLKDNSNRVLLSRQTRNIGPNITYINLKPFIRYYFYAYRRDVFNCSSVRSDSL